MEYGSLTVTNAAIVTLDRVKLYRVVNCTITVEGNPIRFRVDGGEPTISEGHLLQDGDGLVIDSGVDSLNFKCIATGAPATLRVTYSM
jgi:hypothetical protein